MINNIQEEVDTYEGMGLPALQKMQQQNPKLLVGIALENLEKTVQEDQRAKLMGTGETGPSVIDKKLMGLGGLGQQQALATASPGLQQRGKQMQAAQMRKAMGMQPGMQRGMQQAPMRLADGGVVALKEGGFPDLSGDGKVTQKDVLMGRGVVDKAQGGIVGFANRGLVRAEDIDMENLLNALMLAESGGDPDAVSAVGAEGAYQIMPSTAEQPGFGVSPMEGSRFDPDASRSFAKEYLQAMIDRYDGDIEAALIAYNAGAGNADKFIAAGRDYEVLPLAMQTQPYVNRVMGDLEKESRRRDMVFGGGRTISTTAPEGYIERQRRLKREEQRARETASYPRQVEKGTIYKPNIPDALLVAQAQDKLLAPARLQEQLLAIDDEYNKYTPEERAAGGIGYLQYMGRKKGEEAKRASNFLKMMAGNQGMINAADPATNLAGINTNQEFIPAGGMDSPAQRMDEALPGFADSAARYSMSKNVPDLNTDKVAVPESTRGNNLFTNIRDDFGEIVDYVRGLFNEGGEVRGFQEGDLVELEDGEQAVPLSSVSDDPNMFEYGLQLIKDNPVEAASIGLMLVPGVGPAFTLGRIGAGMVGKKLLGTAVGQAAKKYVPKGLAALKDAGSKFVTKPRQAPKNFKMEDPTLLTKSGKPTMLRGQKGFEAATQPRAAVERIPGALKTKKGKAGQPGTTQGLKGQRKPDVRRASPARDALISPRQFSPTRTTGVVGGVGLAGSGLGSLFGSDETAAQTPEALTDMERMRPYAPDLYEEFTQSAENMQRMEREAPALFEAFKKGAEGNKENTQEDRGGILSRLGSALSSDRANSLYDAFQTLGMAGGAARGQEGTQLIANQMARDFQQQELDAMRERIDVDREALETNQLLAQYDLYASVLPYADMIRAGVAEQMKKDEFDPEVLRESIKRLIDGMQMPNMTPPPSGGGTGGGGSSVVRDALNVVGE